MAAQREGRPLLSWKECAKRIAKVSAEAKLEVDEDTYLSSFRPHLMDVVHTWAAGATFAHICKMTDVFEGGARPRAASTGCKSFLLTRGGKTPNLAPAWIRQTVRPESSVLCKRLVCSF